MERVRIFRSPAKRKELLYRFHKELNRPYQSAEDLVGRALVLMGQEIAVDRISSFTLNPMEMVLDLQVSYSSHATLQLDGAIHITETSPLWALLEGKARDLHVARPHPTLYVPLRWPDSAPLAMGAVRFRRNRSLRPFKPAERELALDFAAELAQNLAQARLDEKSREQVKRLAAMTDLAQVFASSLRVEDSLKLILQGIQQHFGFDRVRLYLVEKDRTKLRGELSVDMRGQMKSLRHEEILLEPGVHRFANLILGKGSDPLLEKYKDTILYLPLVVSGQSIGLLVVDNLLSQQTIGGEDAGLLKSFAGQIALAVDNARLFEEVQELSLYDSLTHLPLRRYFNQRFQEELYRAERFGQPVSLIWVDVDHFKGINDTYGHQVGDEVIKDVGRVILKSLRKIDFPCRYGGDEILILLPQAREEEARAIAQRLSSEIREIRVPVTFSKAQAVRVTASMGIATFPADARSAEDLLQKADEALYWVKSHGKDGLALYSETVRPPGPPNPPPPPHAANP